jgi:NitT/TauT family transport system substrate-binding protein
VESRTFRAGPRIAEALIGNAIDVGVLGPLAAASIEARHPGTIKIVSGCASGGASLVVTPAVTRPEHLSGKRVAAPQLGSMPDIALRSWLLANGLDAVERGGTVTVDALAPADVLLQMKRGQLAGAWTTEPWATRIVKELPATRLIDERDLWPEHRFPAAIVVVRRAFADARPAELDALMRAVSAEIDRTLADGAGARADVNAELARLTTKALPAALLEEAWPRVDFTHDPLAGCFPKIADEARALDYLPEVDTARLFA